MNREIEALLKKAKRSQKAATKLFKDGDVDFAASRAIDPKYHNYLIESQDRRNIGDYSIVAEVTEEQTREMLKWAKEFIGAAKEYLEKAQ